ncbi:hypothetical protein QJS10_CPB15g01134 [Acorus calamus]|uniref:Uncharacterized protein n=1 Tax=Acorus calamus TaxID=4465 RepID=A0AAV9D739_ACOCL|nr:hypothetical protein QJS10_CPB15g01134 [Acorus calamus]
MMNKGVESVALQGVDKDQLVVIGEGIDAPCLANTLRKKIGCTEIVTIESECTTYKGKKVNSLTKRLLQSFVGVLRGRASSVGGVGAGWKDWRCGGWPIIH